MIELRVIYEAWGYSNNILKQSNDINDILITLLINCRGYYEIIGFDMPRFEIVVNDQTLNLRCGEIFYDLNTDEKVVDYVRKWYETIQLNQK